MSVHNVMSVNTTSAPIFIPFKFVLNLSDWRRKIYQRQSDWRGKFELRGFSKML